MEAETKTKRQQNPRERANPFSALFFIHMFPIFRRNYKTGVKEDDLFEALEEHKSATLGDDLEKKWKEEHRKHKKSALHRALFRQFAVEFVINGILKLVNEIILLVVMPLAIGGLVAYFQSDFSGISEGEAYMYAGLIILTLLVDAFISHPSLMAMMHMSMKMRVGCCSLIYRKSLRLSRTALAETTIGQIVNLLSNDVSKFDQGFVLCHYVWITPIETAIGTYLLYRAVGVSAFSGIAFLLSFIPLQIYLGKRTSVLRLRTALRTDERVRLMNEILNGIQVIKMYTWEKPFAKLVSFARRYEIKSIRAHFFLQAIMFSLEMFITRTSIFITIIVFVSIGNDITAETAYSITAIYNVLRPIVTMLFSISIASLAEVHISICRLQKFLSYEELPQAQPDLVTNGKIDENGTILASLEKEPVIKYAHPKIHLKHVSAKWLNDSPDNTLTDINLTIDHSQLVAVIGPVGSGKSSLFNALLKELPVSSGFMEIEGKISYAAQEAWLFSASVRQNILFGDAYDEDRYSTVLKICALESDLATFPYGDRTIVGEKGKALSGGQKARINLARCVYKNADIYLLDDPLSAVDTKVGKQLYDECIKKFLCDKICILVTHQLQYLKNADKILILKEGKIIGEGNYDELQTSGLDFAKLLQEFNSGEEHDDGDNKKIKSRQNSEMPEEEYEDDEESVEGTKEGIASGHIRASVYGAYFRSGGNYCVMFLVVLAFIASQAAGNGGDYFVSYWVNLEQEANEMKENNLTDYEEVNRDTISYIYSGITAATIILALGHGVFYFIFFMRASVNMHDRIFEKISRATMRFFNANPTGRILNRFSKDIGIIDEYIPFILSDVVEIALLLIGTIVLTSIVNPWLILPSLGLLVLFYLLRIIYLETSRSVKRIEGTTRSPVFSHMTASMHGLSTIRAFKAQKTLIREFDAHQDLHSSAWYLFISSSRAFGLWLDLICILFVSLVTISLLVFDRDYYGGDVGLIVTQYLSLTGVLQWGMRQWSELENHMTSVERVLEYTKVDTEPVRKQVTVLPKNWPEFGKIIFQNVSMRYNPDDAPVLKNLNFTIYPKEKIGIVGRTGAGKTSTIAALFQLYDIEGSIFIDDIDTTQLPLEELRSKISIIPQEPVLFSGTMRKNLDPFEEYDDETLWNALEQVELKDVIAETPAGLSTNVSESGSNFSIGQRQLVCLARAIIRNNKILVMDEATANVDPHTDVLIQSTMRKKFADCTVITIAHRLHTIMDSDRVLVIDAGQIVEFDHPYNLLQHTDSIFHTMVQTTGKAASKNLQTIAEEGFLKLKNT